jgi:hypothetical protein
MIEKNDFNKYPNKPHVKVKIDGQIVGLISPIGGLNKEVMSVDILLSLPKYKQELLANERLLKKIANKEKVEVETLIAKIYSAKTPKAFINIR